MDITPYVDHLRRDLLAAAESAGPEVVQAAERLGFALDPAVRLTLMEAISQAASEITAEMATGGVDVRLDGRDLAFVVDSPQPAPEAAPAATGVAATEEDDDGNVARITLRIPESVKAKAEDAAGMAGQSLNTWLVGLVRSATRSGVINVDLDLSSIPFGGRAGGRRMSGWI